MDYRPLDITVISARDLKSVNILSKMGVYAVVSLSGDPRSKQKTPVDKEGGTSPTWNFPITFNIQESQEYQYRTMLVFKFRTRRTLGYRSIGEVHVPIRQFLEDSPRPRDGMLPKFLSYQVSRPSGKPKGVLNISYRLGRVGGSDSESDDGSESGDESVTPLALPGAGGSSLTTGRTSNDIATPYRALPRPNGPDGLTHRLFDEAVISYPALPNSTNGSPPIVRYMPGESGSPYPGFYGQNVAYTPSPIVGYMPEESVSPYPPIQEPNVSYLPPTETYGPPPTMGTPPTWYPPTGYGQTPVVVGYGYVYPLPPGPPGYGYPPPIGTMYPYPSPPAGPGYGYPATAGSGYGYAPMQQQQQQQQQQQPKKKGLGLGTRFPWKGAGWNVG